MSFKLFSPSIAAWLFFSAAYWPEDRGRAVLAAAAGMAALVGYIVDGVSSSIMGPLVVAGAGVVLVVLDLGLAGDAVGLGNLAASGAALVACGLAPHRRALIARDGRRRSSERLASLAPVTSAI
jgi:hypothetical protein